MTILLVLLHKTPALVVFLSALIFVLLFLPVWKFWWIEEYMGRQIFFTFLLAAGCCLIGYAAWPWQGTGENKIDSFLEGQQRTEEKVDQLLKSRGVSPQELLAKYPLGYVIFEIDYEERVFPYTKKLLEQYDFDWSVTQLTNISANEVHIRIPDITWKQDNSHAKNMSVTLPKQAGVSADFVSIDEVGISIEILAVRKTGTVFLVGFRQKPPLQKKLAN